MCPLTWETFPEAARKVFQGFRSPAGEEMVLQNNVFVERVLPGSVVRTLTEEEMAVYRKPYTEPGESRRPTLTWPRQDSESRASHPTWSRSSNNMGSGCQPATCPNSS